jgi:hypothetical protein
MNLPMRGVCQGTGRCLRTQDRVLSEGRKRSVRLGPDGSFGHACYKEREIPSEVLGERPLGYLWRESDEERLPAPVISLLRGLLLI